jgi:hypothetical protein
MYVCGHVKKGSVSMWSQVVQDFEAGVEYTEAVEILKSRRKGDAKEYLIRWADEFPDSWESEDNVRQSMVLAFERGSSASKSAESKDSDATVSKDVADAAMANV